MSVCIGTCYNDIHKLQESFLQANRCSYYRFLKGTDQVIFFEDINVDQENKYMYPYEQENQLILAIKQGNIQQVEQTVKQIINSTIDQIATPEAAQLICFGIVNTVIKTLYDIGIEINQEIDGAIERLMNQSFETIDRVEKNTLVFCTKICTFIEQKKESSNFATRDKLLEYVLEHHTDNTLSLESIASSFGMSPSYISRFFKNQTGYSLMRYIDMIRMKQAKKLLKSPIQL